VELRHGRSSVRGVVVVDQRRWIDADNPRDIADVASGVEVAHAGGEVVALDIADDDRPDPGAFTDLSHRQASLLARLRERLPDAHCPSPPSASS